MPSIYKIRVLGGVTCRESSNVFLLKIKALLNSEVEQRESNVFHKRNNTGVASYIYLIFFFNNTRPSLISLIFSLDPATTFPNFTKYKFEQLVSHQPKMCKA